MKTFASLGLVVVLSSFLPLTAGSAELPPGYIDFGELPVEQSDRQFVEVQIRSHLIRMAARLAEKQEPEVAAVLRNLEYVRVNVIGVSEQNRSEVEEKIRQVTEQADRQGWEQVVQVRDGRERVTVQTKTKGEEAVLGVLVTMMDGGKEAVLVNVVGDIRPEQLAMIGERFELEPLKKLRKHSSAQRAKSANNPG